MKSTAAIFSEISKLEIFADYCLSNQLPQLLLTTIQHQKQRVALDNLPITEFKNGDKIYVHLINWSANNSWYKNLRLPQQPYADYMVQGKIMKISGKKKNTCSINFPVFNETYTISHSELNSYNPSISIDFGKQILVTNELVILHPQIMKENTDSNNLEFIPSKILQNR